MSTNTGVKYADDYEYRCTINRCLRLQVWNMQMTMNIGVKYADVNEHRCVQQMSTNAGVNMKMIINTGVK